MLTLNQLIQFSFINRNDYINFTLFFVEKEATSSQIIGVIETSAEKKKENTKEVAVVDKFELELDSVEVNMDRRMEPETFNKKTVKVKTTTTTTTTRPTGKKAAPPTAVVAATGTFKMTIGGLNSIIQKPNIMTRISCQS